MVTFYAPKCWKLHDDSFPLYGATEGGTENLLCTLAHVIMFDALPVGRTACRASKKIMESLRTFVFVETVLRRGRMFQGSDEV